MMIEAAKIGSHLVNRVCPDYRIKVQGQPFNANLILCKLG